MTRFGIVMALSALIGAAGAATAGPPPPPPPAQGADAAIWEGEAGAGPIVHRASKVALPFRLEGFTRERVAAVAPDDVAAAYRYEAGEDKADLTLYLFRTGALPEHSLKGSVTAFGVMHPSAFIWGTGPFDVPGPTPLHAWKGAFKTGIGPESLMDYLYFVDLGAWRVKVRATVQGIKELEQEDRIDRFVRTLPWAQILAANGACSGAACTAPPFEAFDSHFMELALGPLLASKMKFDAKKERSLPVAARASLPLTGEVEVRRSDEGDLVYVAKVDGMATYRLVRLPAPASALFTAAFGKMSIDKPLFGLLIRMGKSDLMPRLFHGEPTPGAFAAAVGELILHPTADPFVTVAATAAAMPD